MEGRYEPCHSTWQELHLYMQFVRITPSVDLISERKGSRDSFPPLTLSSDQFLLILCYRWLLVQKGDGRAGKSCKSDLLDSLVYKKNCPFSIKTVVLIKHLCLQRSKMKVACSFNSLNVGSHLPMLMLSILQMWKLTMQVVVVGGKRQKIKN